MAFVWVQQWVALPIVLENQQMGDLPASSLAPTLDITAAGLHDEHQASSFRSPSNNTPFQSQLSSIPLGQGRLDIRSPAHPMNPHYPGPDHGASSLNMGAMAGALPEYASLEPSQANAQTQAQRPLSGASTSALVYQLQQNLQIPAHGSGPLPAHSPYGSGLSPGQYQQNFVPNPASHPNYAFHPNQQRMPGPSGLQAPYQNFHQPSQYMYYPSPYSPQGQFPQGFAAQSNQSQVLYGRRPSLSGAPMPMMGQNMDLSQHDGVYAQGARLIPGTVQGEPGPVGSILSGTFGAPGE